MYIYDGKFKKTRLVANSELLKNNCQDHYVMKDMLNQIA